MPNSPDSSNPPKRAPTNPRRLFAWRDVPLYLLLELCFWFLVVLAVMLFGSH